MACVCNGDTEDFAASFDSSQIQPSTIGESALVYWRERRGEAAGEHGDHLRSTRVAPVNGAVSGHVTVLVLRLCYRLY